MKIVLTAGNVNRGHFYIERESTFFPADAWGGGNASAKALPVVFEFSGTGERVETDIAGDKRIPRNARGQCDRFFTHHGLSAGDHIEVERINVRHFRVSPIEQSSASSSLRAPAPARNSTPARSRSFVQRIIRDSKVVGHVKNLYGCRCQVCNVAIETISGRYAEGAHIRALGRPHNGPDVPGNVLCLCPNHHVMLDGGTLTINDDQTLNGAPGRLHVHPAHKIGLSCLRYHRNYARQIAAVDRHPATRSVGG